MGSSIKADVGDSAMISRLTMQIGMRDAAESAAKLLLHAGGVL